MSAEEPKVSAEERKRTVASGFPPPDTVPGPTERLRQLHGDSNAEPLEPRYGRTTVGTAGTDDVVPLEGMKTTTADRARASGDAVETFGHRVTDEAIARAQREFERRGIGDRIQLAGAGARRLGVGAALGVCAAGAATAGVVLLWNKALPAWAAALATAGTFGAVALPFALSGGRQFKRGVSGPQHA
jgi:Putative Actinobacterial Holin-X, holin superfamily III